MNPNYRHRDYDRCVDCGRPCHEPLCDECFEARAYTSGKDLVPVECPACLARFIGAGRKDRRWAHMIEEGHVPMSWTVPAKFRLKAERFRTTERVTNE